MVCKGISYRFPSSREFTSMEMLHGLLSGEESWRDVVQLKILALLSSAGETDAPSSVCVVFDLTHLCTCRRLAEWHFVDLPSLRILRVPVL